MTITRLKKEIFKILSLDDFTEIKNLVKEYEPKDIANILFSAITRPEENIRWNGIKLFGLIASEIANQNPEEARMLMRRLLWSLNDESGGIGWGAPESIAEAIINNELIAKEYLHMLISYTQGDGPELHQDGNFIELPELQRGLLWGILRIVEEKPELMLKYNILHDIEEYALSNDAIVRDLAKKITAHENLK